MQLEHFLLIKTNFKLFQSEQLSTFPLFLYLISCLRLLSQQLCGLVGHFSNVISCTVHYRICTVTV